MTIERISFPDGLVIEDPQDISLERLLPPHLDKAQALPEGEYYLTPKSWQSHKYTHHLTVEQNGNGRIRLIPRYEGAYLKEISANDLNLEKDSTTHSGGKVAEMPGDQSTFLLAGPSKDIKNIAIYEIIFHVPGSSPIKTAEIDDKPKSIEETVYDINNITDAKRLIVDSAKEKILALDWDDFPSVDKSRLTALLELYPIILRQSDINPTLNIFRTTDHGEKAILDQLPADHKSPLTEGFCLVMLRPTISKVEAIALRNLIFLKFPELVAGVEKLNIADVILHFSKTNQEYRDAGIRYLDYLATYKPELL
jgi:hypothetical protein